MDARGFGSCTGGLSFVMDRIERTLKSMGFGVRVEMDS